MPRTSKGTYYLPAEVEHYRTNELKRLRERGDRERFEVLRDEPDEYWLREFQQQNKDNWQ